MKVSIITTCKGRLAHAKQSIPKFLNQKTSFDFNVIVVDFGCPEGVSDWVDFYQAEKNIKNLSRIFVLSNTGYFHLARARNIGAIQPSISNDSNCIINDSDILCFADIDHLLPDTWLQKYITYMEFHNLDLCNANFDKRNPKLWELEFFGLACIRRDCFLALHGFDEAFRNWGYDDVDLWYRVRRIDIPKRYNWGYLPADIELINHTEEESMRYCEIKTIKESGEINRAIMENTSRVVNPGMWGQL